MPRRFNAPELLIASHNKGKVRELEALFVPYKVTLTSAAEFNVTEPEETGSTFAENAHLKAQYYSQQTGLPALADDSGLWVKSLGGEPGIYSARWAGPQKDFIYAMRLVQEKLEEKVQKTNEAAFICSLCLYWPDGHSETVEGKVEGTLTFPPRGEHGFGYDPIFIPNGHLLTFGEMSAEEKNTLSHRTKAFHSLIEACFS